MTQRRADIVFFPPSLPFSGKSGRKNSPDPPSHNSRPTTLLQTLASPLPFGILLTRDPNNDTPIRGKIRGFISAPFCPRAGIINSPLSQGCVVFTTLASPWLHSDCIMHANPLSSYPLLHCPCCTLGLSSLSLLASSSLLPLHFLRLILSQGSHSLSAWRRYWGYWSRCGFE